MFTNLVYIFEKTLLLWPLILSICWHGALPFLKLPRAANFTALKDDREISRNFKKTLLFFF